ncbi:MAG: hypothetical protein F6K56_24735 [Moorea sp. SIO3G5]|nr:hypothetical protein [Moorena sp. SIO3G5]
MPATVDEQALKSAIKSLINSSQVKSEAVLEIAGALGNQKITSDYWHRLFDGQGAQHALSQNLYTPQFVRLITLRAMVIPETLPEFLDWLNIKGGRQRPDNNQVISLQFQEAIGSQLPPEQLARGIKLILPKLLARQITPEAVHWLLAARHSAWKHYRKQFINDVQADLEVISSLNRLSNQWSYNSESNSFRCGDKIWNKLINFWRLIRRRHRHSEPYYQPLAKLFEWLREYFLSAYFYQVGFGEVPKEIFNKAFTNSRKSVQYAFGLPIKQRMNRQEQISKQYSGILNFIRGNIEFVCIIIGLSLLSLTITYTLMVIITTQSPKPTPEPNTGMTEEQKKSVAVENFKTTSQSIQTIVQELVNDSELKPKLLQNHKKFPNKPKQPHKPEDQVAIVIKEILGNTDLQYAGVIKHESENSNIEKDKEKWVEAIYAYQKNKNQKLNKELKVDGIIHYLPGQSNSTYEHLKNDTKQHLIKKLDNQTKK